MLTIAGLFHFHTTGTQHYLKAFTLLYSTSIKMEEYEDFMNTVYNAAEHTFTVWEKGVFNWI